MISFIPSAVAASSTIHFLPMWIMFGLSISIINLYERSDYVANQKQDQIQTIQILLRISL